MKGRTLIISIAVFFIIYTVALIFIISSFTKTDNSWIKIYDKQQKQTEQNIERISYSLDSVTKLFNTKLKEDSILNVKTKKEISKIYLDIKKQKDANDKKRLINSVSNTGESYNTLKSNIKDRTKK